MGINDIIQYHNDCIHAGCKTLAPLWYVCVCCVCVCVCVSVCVSVLYVHAYVHVHVKS